MSIVLPHGFEIQKLQDGGYLVGNGLSPGDYRFPLFACTTIDEALKYIKSKLEPKLKP